MSTEPLLRPFLVAILVIAAFFVGAWAGARSEDGGGVVDLVGGDEAPVTSDALEAIEESYFEEVDPEQLENASVRAMVEKLKKQYKDRFSHYIGPDEADQLSELTEGRFSGVGMSVIGVERGLRVARVFDGSPAKEAGMREGDVVIAVNGTSIAGKDADVATAQIKGKPGTEVTLSVLRPSTGDERELKLTRRELAVPVVDGEMRDADGRKVGHVQLISFSRGAADQLREEVERLYDEGAEGIVLDLRGNGGGLLDEAVLTSSVFVEDGPIVSTEGRTQPKETLDAVGDALDPKPMVVLIDGNTASASEILTEALSDAGLATVAGEKSFGKGSFQEVIELENGGALDLTVGEYLTRDGDSINGVGIEPDVPARDRPATRPDEGLNEALRALGAALAGQQQ